MLGRWIWTWIVLLVACTGDNALAQVVQLPVYHQFGVSTTVVVPDRGGVVLGGVDRYRESVTRFGPQLPLIPGNRGMGYEVEHSMVGVSATILDLDEWDRQVLQEASRRASWYDGTAQASPIRDFRPLAATDRAPVAPERVAQEAREQQIAKQREAAELLERGRRFAQAGRMVTARHFLNLARKRADPQLALQIQQELARLEGRTGAATER